tara:strand:- start:312 stop:1739 length:1428 start_codon:yes stop_codon:yes gene_type:complete
MGKKRKGKGRFGTRTKKGNTWKMGGLKGGNGRLRKAESKQVNLENIVTDEVDALYQTVGQRDIDIKSLGQFEPNEPDYTKHHIDSLAQLAQRKLDGEPDLNPWQELAKVYIGMHQRLAYDPLVRAYIDDEHKWNISGRPLKLSKDSVLRMIPIRQMWQVEALKRVTWLDVITTIRWNRRNVSAIETEEDFYNQLQTPRYFFEIVQTMAEVQATYHWDAESMEVSQAMPVQRHILDDKMLPLDKMLFIFENPVKLIGGRFLRWMFVEKFGDGVHLTFDNRNWNNMIEYQENWENDSGDSVDASEGGDTIRFMKIPFGIEYPLRDEDILWDESFPDALRDKLTASEEFEVLAISKELADYVVHLLVFLSSGASEVVERDLSRAERKRYANREDGTEIDTDKINVITIPRMKFRGSYLPSNVTHGSERKIKYRGSWFVSGHNRKQRIGMGRKDWKWKYIRTYMKGEGELIKRIAKVRT